MNEKKAPAIRFQKFTDFWGHHNFGTISYRESTKQLSSEEYPCLEYDDVISETGQLNKDIHAKKVQKTGIIFDNNKVLYGKLRPYLHNWIAPEFIGVATGDWWVLNPCGNNKDFLYALIQTKQFDTIANQSTGSKMPRADWKLVSSAEFYVPPIEEQRKIGECFHIIDNLISLHQRKLTKLKLLKKSMLTKMFPKDGARVPEIRFQGFHGDWKKKNLLNLLDQPITDGPHETPNIVVDGVPFISADAIVNNKIDFSRKRGYITEKYNLECSKKYKPQLYDVYLVKSGSTVGKVAIVETTEKFNIWSPLAAMRCKETSNPYFLYFLLLTKEIQNQVKDKASNGTQPNLSMRTLEKFNVVVPEKKEEQKAIGLFFQKLDKTIALQQCKLSKLQQIKQAMLSKLFV